MSKLISSQVDLSTLTTRTEPDNEHIRYIEHLIQYVGDHFFLFIF